MQNGSLGPKEAVLPNGIQSDTSFLLHDLVIAGDDKKLAALLQTGADITLKDTKHGNTPLHEAAWRGFSRCVSLLCALPKPIKSEKDSKESKIKIVVKDTRFFLHSALLGTRNYGGFSALHLASQNGHNQSCREILLAGADPNVQNNYGDTPLHTACRYGHAGATRILLSGKSDPRIVNLNGDTPLHIAAAMGRRKLTKILLEAGSLLTIKNAQNETVCDIAVRKNLKEILEILNTPIEQIRKERDRSLNSSKNENSKNDGENNNKKSSKTSSKDDKKKCKHKETQKNPTNWSPYGCHYSPDPRDFPPPKLETLPKDPLSKGEQYFLDLAGNIKKGPIGIGNTCYCAPFFRHLEERISKNKKCIKKYVDRATEKIDNKVAALALKTDDQIEELTRSIISHRRESQDCHQHLEDCIQRGSKERKSTTNVQKHSESKSIKRMSRCRSLDFLECDSLDTKSIQPSSGISKSVEILDKNDIIIHPQPQNYSQDEQRSSKNRSNSEQSQVSSSNHRHSVLFDPKISQGLQGLDELLKIRRRKTSISTLSSAEKPINKRLSMLESPSTGNRSRASVNYDFEDTSYIAREMNKITSSLLGVSIPQELPRPSDVKQSPLASDKFIDQSRSVSRSDENRSIINHKSIKNDNSFVSTSFYQNNNFDLDDEDDHDDDDDEEDEEIKEETEIFSSSPTNTIKTQSSYLRRCIQSVIQKNNSNDNLNDQHEIEDASNGNNEIIQLKNRILNGGTQWQNKNHQILQRNPMMMIKSDNEINSIDKISPAEIKTTTTKYEIKNSEIRPLKSASYSKHPIPTNSAPDYDNNHNINDYGSDVSSNEDLNTYQIKHINNDNSIYWNHHQTYENLRLQQNYYQPTEIERNQPQIANYITGLNQAPKNSIESTATAAEFLTFRPKDAYYHELPSRNHNNIINNNQYTVQDHDYITISSRNRKPLPLNFDETNILPQPEIQIPQNHKFHETLEIDVTPRPNYSPLRTTDILTIDQVQIDRDLNNDSGYSTKMWGSSAGASPALTGQIDLGGNINREIETVTEKSEDWYISNIRTSSLV